MRIFFTALLTLIFCFKAGEALPQDSLLQQMVSEHYAKMKYEAETNNFSGPGWEQIADRVQRAQNILIGEDHFTNEIPAFTEAVMKTVDIENFIIEMDPYSTEIIEQSIREMSDIKRAGFNQQYRSFFSFYALEPEYKLLEGAVRNNINLLGAEQIVKYGDQLVLQELAEYVSDHDSSVLVEDMIEKSDHHFRKFQEDRDHILNFESEEFGNDLQKLSEYEIPKYAQQIIRDMRISREIYSRNDHARRIGLIKRILLDSLDVWRDHRNLFKYGAVHMPRGESLLRIYDVGNLVANVSDAQFSESYHVMVFGSAGMKGGPFAHSPNSKVDTSTGMLSKMKPFFRVMAEHSNQWFVFNMLPLRRAMREGKLSTQDSFLERIIEGYDTVVIIPEVTPADF